MKTYKQSKLSDTLCINKILKCIILLLENCGLMIEEQRKIML